MNRLLYGAPTADLRKEWLYLHQILTRRFIGAGNLPDTFAWPTEPTGQESNWLYTAAGQKWFPWSRLYGPEKAVFDKSFKLPDIERVN